MDAILKAFNSLFRGVTFSNTTFPFPYSLLLLPLLRLDKETQQEFAARRAIYHQRQRGSGNEVE
jgi:hypothetical protein